MCLNEIGNMGVRGRLEQWLTRRSISRSLFKRVCADPGDRQVYMADISRNLDTSGRARVRIPQRLRHFVPERKIRVVLPYRARTTSSLCSTSSCSSACPDTMRCRSPPNCSTFLSYNARTKPMMRDLLLLTTAATFRGICRILGGSSEDDGSSRS